MSVALRFPGNGMIVNVPAGTCFDIFPQGGDYSAYENVEYRVGEPAVSFRVKLAVIQSQPESFLAKQLSYCATMGKDFEATESADCLKVTLKTHDPLLFPIVFCFLNQTFTDPSIASIPTAGLSPDEIAQVTELADGFLGIKTPLVSLLFQAKRPLVDAAAIQIAYSGLLSISPDGPLCTNTGKAAVSEDGRITYTDALSGSKLAIDLKKIRTEEPWVPSMAEDQLREMRRIARQTARENAQLPSLIASDPLPPVSDDVPLYPFPVDHRTSFFIPATAIVCMVSGTTADQTRVVCEGVYDTEADMLRIQAINQEEHNMLWAEMQVLH